MVRSIKEMYFYCIKRTSFLRKTDLRLFMALAPELLVDHHDHREDVGLGRGRIRLEVRPQVVLQILEELEEAFFQNLPPICNFSRRF